MMSSEEPEWEQSESWQAANEQRKQKITELVKRSYADSGERLPFPDDLKFEIVSWAKALGQTPNAPRVPTEVLDDMYLQELSERDNKYRIGAGDIRSQYRKWSNRLQEGNLMRADQVRIAQEEANRPPRKFVGRDQVPAAAAWWRRYEKGLGCLSCACPPAPGINGRGWGRSIPDLVSGDFIIRTDPEVADTHRVSAGAMYWFCAKCHFVVDASQVDRLPPGKQNQLDPPVVRPISTAPFNPLLLSDKELVEAAQRQIPSLRPEAFLGDSLPKYLRWLLTQHPLTQLNQSLMRRLWGRWQEETGAVPEVEPVVVEPIDLGGGVPLPEVSDAG